MKHQVIKTDNYLIVVDDSEIKIGDYHVAIRIIKTNGDKAIAFTDQEQLEAIAEIGGAKKIIAHLPLNNHPILKGVPLFPPISRHQENGIEELAEKKLHISDVISCFTLEDITKIVNAFTDINIPIEAVNEEIELKYL